MVAVSRKVIGDKLLSAISSTCIYGRDTGIINKGPDNRHEQLGLCGGTSF